MERNEELEAYNKMLFYLIKDQTEQRERLEKEIERLSVVIDEKQQKIDYYEGTYFTIEAAAKERMAIIQQQQAPVGEVSEGKCISAFAEDQKPFSEGEIALQNQDFSYLYTEEERARFDWCRREQGGWNYRPLFSIVVPVYKTPVRLLDEMIGSVVRQSYPQWELCIANASPENEKLCEALEVWQQKDSRIRVKELSENGGISG